MLHHTIEKVRQQEVFSREDTLTGRRIFAAFLYHAGLSYRRLEPFIERSYEAIQQFHRLQHVFEPDCRDWVAVNETEIDVNGETVYDWTAVDCDTLEVV